MFRLNCDDTLASVGFPLWSGTGKINQLFTHEASAAAAATTTVQVPVHHFADGRVNMCNRRYHVIYTLYKGKHFYVALMCRVYC